MMLSERIAYFYKMYTELLNFKNLSWWLIDLKDDPNIFYCNDIMCKTFNLDEDVVQHSVKNTCPIAGDFNNNVAISNSEKAKQIFNEYHQLKQGYIDEYKNSFPYFDSRSETTEYFTSRAKALVKDELGNAEVLFGIIEPQNISAELYKQSRTDSLTGLFNRREFDSQLSFLLKLASREQHEISLIICDIDHFKQYNDNAGHYAGDECIVKIARCISSVCVRPTDIACRYGGEEFAIILYASDSEANFLAESIRKEVLNKSLPHPSRVGESVTISAGYFTLVPDSTTTPRTLIENADKALYKAKQSGRNSCVKYESDC